MSISLKADPSGTYGEILVNGQVVAKLPVTGNAVIPNLVGTVSQSGGVPTGAIIERGSNSNGEYIRFADGTQICTHTVEIAVSVSFQNVFGSTAGTMWRQVQNWTYPATFAANPSIAAGSARVAAPVEFSTNSPSSVFVIPYSNQNGAVIAVFLTAAGRWY